MGAALRFETLTGAALDKALDDVARLRIEVFRDWPYLYDGNLAYEQDYLQSYRNNPMAILVAAFDGEHLVGASTGTPLADHADDFSKAFEGSDIDLSRVFYCAESVLLREYRGRGAGHDFFDTRETHARDMGFEKSAFCAVVRPQEHPLRPESYVPLDGFWSKRKYAKLPGVLAEFRWKDIDQPSATTKSLQFWIKDL